MRRSLLIAALLGSTMLTPEPAEAQPPVVGFVAGALGVGAGAAATIGIATATGTAFAAGAAFGGSLLGGFLVKTVVAVGLSKLAQKLQSRPEVSQLPPSARMVNFAQPKVYAETVYGITRKGGPLGFTGFKNSRRYYVPILAAHPINGIVQHWLDERIVALNGNTNQNSSNVTTSPISGHGRVDVFTGDPGQTANPGLVSAFSEITSAHDFAGLAGAYLWAKRPPQENFTNIYPSGRQWAWAPVLEGKKDLYDPRDDTTKYENNAALVLANWITDKLGREVDWDEVSIESDVADELVTIKDGGVQPRWTLNGTISDEQEFEEQRALLAASCDAFIYERTDGKVGFTLGRWIEPTITLTPDDFDSLEITEGQWGGGAPDEVAVTYMEPINNWREAPSGTWIEEEVAKPIRDEPSLPLVNSHNQAARLNKRFAKAKRAKYQLRGQIGLMGYELLGGGENGKAHRFFRVNDGEGLDAVFEVGEIAKEGIATFTLEARSAEESDFAFDAATEEPDRPEYGEVENDGTLPTPSNVQGAALAASVIAVTWDAQADPIYDFEVRYRVTGAAEWKRDFAAPTATSIALSGFMTGETIEIQVRHTKLGIGSSDWEPDPALEVTTL
ncbi:hypothetical protein [Ruegeria jejuensis]|uniref:hypothetical protein n=1 Tax=Ruegeria jejuensis TaxID=3233338 RepID=UPI00355C59AE